MALVKCPECGKENVSDSAVACPECGFPISSINNKNEIDFNNHIGTRIRKNKKSDRKHMCIILVLIGFFVLGIYFVLNSNIDLKEINITSDNLKEIPSDGLNTDKIKEMKLEKAQELVSVGSYQEAIVILQSLDTYGNSVALLKQCLYESALEKYNSQKYIDAITILDNNQLLIYESAVELKKKIIEEQKENCIALANDMYKSGDFYGALEYFEAFLDYSEQEENTIYKYCCFMKSIQGEYISPISDRISSVRGTMFIEDGKVEYTIIPCEVENNNVKKVVGMLNGDEKHYISFIENGEIWSIRKQINDDWDVWVTEEHYTQDQERIESSKPKEPLIGMNHEEVRASTWGEPEDINKTTYSWGTTEQWCYSDYRYIYFDNGIVTAISE